MPFLARFRKQQEDPEVSRRKILLRAGRLGEATSLGTDIDAEGNVVLSYSYTIGGVDYETVQRLDEQQVQRKSDYLPGSKVQLKYDPRHPENSFVV